jgi:hypothetical protein
MCRGTPKRGHIQPDCKDTMRATGCHRRKPIRARITLPPAHSRSSRPPTSPQQSPSRSGKRRPASPTRTAAAQWRWGAQVGPLVGLTSPRPCADLARLAHCSCWPGRRRTPTPRAARIGDATRQPAEAQPPRPAQAPPRVSAPVNPGRAMDACGTGDSTRQRIAEAAVRGAPS